MTIGGSKMKWIGIMLILALAMMPAVIAAGNVNSASGMQEKAQVQERTEVQEQAENESTVQTAAKGMVRVRMNQRATIKEISDELRVCKGKRTDACNEKRTEARVTAKNALTDTADKAEALLLKLKENFQASEADGKDELIANLDSTLTKVAEVRKNEDALGENSTKKEFQDARKELRAATLEVKQMLREGAYKIVSHKLGNAVMQSEKADEKLKEILSKLAEKGVSTEGVDLADFESKIAQAKELNQKAQELFDQAKGAEENQRATLMKQATEKLRESHLALKQARTMLQEKVRAIKALRSETQETE